MSMAEPDDMYVASSGVQIQLMTGEFLVAPSYSVTASRSQPDDTSSSTSSAVRATDYNITSVSRDSELQNDCEYAVIRHRQSI